MTDAVSSQTATSLMARLRESTREHHRRAEQRELQRELLAGELPRETFAAYLGELLCVHRGLERRLAARSAGDRRIASVFRQHHVRESDLVADLEFYGLEPGTPTESARRLLVDFDHWENECPAALLGVLYVLEGSMNGNRFIARVLRQKWGLDSGPGLRYLDPYGDEQPERWAEFRAVMDAQDFSPMEEGAVLRAAQRTFDAVAAIADTLVE